MSDFQFRDPLLDVSGAVIGFYEREFFFLSNFASFAVEWKGRIWPTSEHAYQAAHFFETVPEVAGKIFEARSAHDAKKIAEVNKEKAVKDWEAKKISVMEDICRSKLEQHPYIRRKLLETGSRVLVEDSPKDDFWGWGPKRNGRNELGKIWMRLRAEITR